jgi:hypothetical protein
MNGLNCLELELLDRLELFAMAEFIVKIIIIANTKVFISGKFKNDLFLQSFFKY